ncbi:MAG: hypothetical protein HY010_07865 [Acidobacteria bacterium]|nr:hypothetical protein [Acidobacteriota bacterium]
MRYAAVLALALAGLTMTASAQKPQKVKTKPSHSEEKESKGSHAVREPANRTSAAQELKRVEQSGSKLSVRKSENAKPARVNPALRAQRKDANPPIHFASSGGSGKGGKGKAGDPYKGRLRHKGNRH